MSVLAAALQDRLIAVASCDDAAIDIADAALAISAAVRRAEDTDAALRHLKSLADDTAHYLRGTDDTLALRAEALTHGVVRQYGYGCADESGFDTESSPDDACLMTAVEARQGSGLVLGLLFLHVAQRLGWQADALDFPARLLIRLDAQGDRLIIDPQAGGRMVAPHELRALLKEASGAVAELTPQSLRPMESRALLYRYHSDLKMRLLRQGRLEDALHAAEAMLLAAPKAAPLWREAGMIHARLDNIEAAVGALEAYLRIADEEEGRYKASQMLRDLRARLL